MTFSKDWENLYKSGLHLSVWPWSDLVSFVMRYAKPNHGNFRVLELGCGAGANIPFFLNMGVDYWSIDGSQSIIDSLVKIYPQLEGRLLLGDFTKDLPFTGQFDLIVDRGSVTHNKTESIQSALSLAKQKLLPNGKFIGIDWFSTEHSEYKNGRPTEDVYVRHDYTEGPLKNIGIVHFTDKQHLLDLFSNFSVQVLEHHVESRHIPEDGWRRAAWNLVALNK